MFDIKLCENLLKITIGAQFKNDNGTKQPSILESAQILDDADPINITLKSFMEQSNELKDIEIILVDGRSFFLTKVIQIGYGAAIICISQEYYRITQCLGQTTQLRGAIFDKKLPYKKEAQTSIRYSAIAMIHQIDKDKADQSNKPVCP